MKTAHFDDDNLLEVIGEAPSASANTWMRLNKAEIDERIAQEVKLVQLGDPTMEKRGLERYYVKNALDLKKYNAEHIKTVCKKHKSLQKMQKMTGLSAENSLQKFISKVSNKQTLKALEAAENDEREARRIHRQGRAFPRQMMRSATTERSPKQKRQLRRLATDNNQAQQQRNRQRSVSPKRTVSAPAAQASAQPPRIPANKTRVSRTTQGRSPTRRAMEAAMDSQKSFDL